MSKVEFILFILATLSLSYAIYVYVKNKPKTDYSVCKYNNITDCYEKCCCSCDNQECQIRCSANYKKCGGHVEVEK